MKKHSTSRGFAAGFRWLIPILAAALLPACGGSKDGKAAAEMEDVSDDPEVPGDPDDPPGGQIDEGMVVVPGGIELSECGQAGTLSESPWLKLTRQQYQNTVRDLLTASGAESVLPQLQSVLNSIPEDSRSKSFRGLDNRISLEHVQGYFNVAVAAADAITSDSQLLSAVAGDCATEATLSDDCVTAFVEGFAQRAYRHPLSDAEIETLASLNDGSMSGAETLRAMIIVVMNSPRFVNHVEINGAAIDGAQDELQLDVFEVASRLSYALWQTLPDDELIEVAMDGSLATEDGLKAQLDRMFEDPRAKENVWTFWNEWLALEGFTGFEVTRPGFQALAQGELVGEEGHEHYADMVQEVRDLTQLFVFEREAPLSELLTTDLSVTPSADLAKLYGVEPYAGNGDYPSLPEGTRVGLLQRGALLVNALEGTNPFHRGAIVKRNLLCAELPQPDPNSLPPGSLELPETTDAETTRERYQAKIAGNGLCEGCHTLFSDVGYVLESFDALGRYRTTEVIFDEETGETLAELPIDTSATITIGELEREVTGPSELNQAIVDSGQVEACMAQKYFQFAMRRALSSQTEDVCLVDDLTQKLADPDQGMSAAFKSIAMYSSFFQRKVGAQ